ncbi:MAG TPA: hypothetical protein P5567_01840 [Kiritimatiellia bacterium]|nr:hypothetical protein [Kiritimatiellia bacterium]HRZ11176.1 hypothetical protein [Kiritimatiellia bacterium]HSA19027.1 hypothetical protein [Kiritimatiellia bacterium]
MRRRQCGMMAAMLATALSAAAETAPMADAPGWRWMVSPMAGADRNELKMRTPMGPVTVTDNGPEYGLVVMALHPNVVVNNFFFYSDVNDCDVWGDLFFANYYADAKSAVTWNAGVGYLWHEIKPEGAEIKVNVPMIKAGPVFRVKAWHLFLNPYLGYGWERVDSPGGEQDNDSFLYGLTAAWRWRMLEAGVNYYYQDSQDLDPDEDFNVLRARLIAMVNRTWGVSARVDYMEHSTSDDFSGLIGPVWMF